jgi:hypothetical protein
MQKTRRYRGPASIVHAAGETPVTCELVLIEPSQGLVEWSGVYWDAELSNEPEPGDGLIRLPDGAEAPIIVNTEIRSDHTIGVVECSGTLTGNGDPPVFE